MILGEVDVVEHQAFQLAAIAPIGGGGHVVSEGVLRRAGEDGFVGHERAEDVGQRHHAIGLRPGDVVDQRLQRGVDRMVPDEVRLGVDFAQEREVEDAASGSVNAAPWLPALDDLRDLWEGGAVRLPVRCARSWHVLFKVDVNRIPYGDEEGDDDFGGGEGLVDGGLGVQLG